MSQIHFLVVGKLKNKACASLADDYFDRLKHYVLCSLTEIKDGTIEKTDEKIIRSVDRSDFVVLLDVKGKTFTSELLAEWFQKQSSLKKIIFIIGGAYGVGEGVKKRANLIW